jgi:FKBP-type peptidyl-prolyl cis-trans isomerase 2
MANAKDGDFVKIEFVGKKATGEVFDTNIEAKAKEAKIHDEKAKYGPSLVVLGKGEVIKGLEEAIAEMGVGQTKTVEIMPDKAFGERRADLVRVMPLSEFRKRDMDPYPGMPIQLDNTTAIVRSVTSGRVMVDMNHPLAGHKVVYEVKLSEVVEGVEKKALALMDHIDIKGEVTAKGEEIHVTFGPKVNKDSEYLVKKATLAQRVLDQMPEVKRVKFEEIYDRQAEKKDEPIVDKKKEPEAKD